MSTVKVGQVWRDKDKRRNTVIEILSVATDKHGSAEAIGLVVGTEETRSYNEERLVKRWELVQTIAFASELAQASDVTVITNSVGIAQAVSRSGASDSSEGE